MTLVKRMLMILILITVVSFIGILLYTNNRTYFNEPDEVGNTAGNLYNGGLFCEKDGKIYFSNDNDDGSLYVMSSNCTNVRKVHEDKTTYINADSNYLYYVRTNNTRENHSDSFFVFNNTGVYRIDQTGKNLKLITSNPGAYLTLHGNNLFLQRYDVENGILFYRYQIDGELERLLYKDALVPSTVINNKLYYTGYSDDHNINYMDLSSYTHHTMFKGNYAFPIFRDDYIYYMDLNNKYKIYRMNLDGTEPTLLVKNRCSTYNITNDGKYLYYQVDDTKNNSIRRLNLETMKSETLLKGNYKQIHVTDNYIFFKDFNNSKTYIQSTDGTSQVDVFNPSDLDSKDNKNTK